MQVKASLPSERPADDTPSTLLPYVVLWLMITIALSYEYFILNGFSRGPSLIRWLYNHKYILKGSSLKPDSGGALSFLLGWVGFAVICLTNPYILRKRAFFLRRVGTIPGWLDFHIFCGLLGTTLIVFHTNFKVGGLVAISFWSMIITFLSGIIGRYIYLQILSDNAQIRARLTYYEGQLKRQTKHFEPKLSDKHLRLVKDQALLSAGATPFIASGKADLLTVFLASMHGDVSLLRLRPHLPRGTPPKFLFHLRKYALLKRRLLTDSYYKQLMGYWHTFHLPFAIFMYVVSVVHIIAALVFKVNH